MPVKKELSDRFLAIFEEYVANDSVQDLVELFSTALDNVESRSCNSSCTKSCTDSCSATLFSDAMDYDRDEIIERILESIKSYLGAENYLALAPGENITIPDWSPEFSDYSEKNTFHVDNFLYDDEDVDALVNEGLIPRSLCLDCGSARSKPTNFISHSASLHQLRWLMEIGIVSELSSNNSCLLDVGSRTGSVLWTSYLYSKAEHIIGVEISDYFCNLQRNILQSQRLNSERISILNCDITSPAGLNILNGTSTFPKPNVVVLNNVFEFFVGEENDSGSSKGKTKAVSSSGSERVREIWHTLKQAILPGTVIVSIPSLEEQFDNSRVDIDLSSWVSIQEMDDRKLSGFKENYSLSEDMVDDIRNISIYRVL